MTRYRPRENSFVLFEALKNMPVVVLSGMRQAGKSTLLKNLPQLSGRRYVNFDDYNILEAARRDPQELILGGKPVIIDEAQKFPEILSVIKREVDRKRRPGQFILSGSANFLLLKNISESLAGRAVYLTLYPFNRREITGAVKESPALVHFMSKGDFPCRKIKPLNWREVIAGGMPSVCLGEVKQPIVWFRGYEQTYLERDIRSLSQVADLISFRHLLQLISLRNGNVLNISELARDAKLTVMTATRYLSLMEASFVIFRLYPYLGNRSSRLIKAPKIYISDSGLAAYLSGARKLDAYEPLRGALLEGYVAQNIQSIISTHSPETKISYWNIQGRFEVDFILETAGRTIAIEVKYGSRLRESDIASLKAYLQTEKYCAGGIVAYNGAEIMKLADKIWAVPVALLIS